jgi:hypothetical protein
LSKEKEHKAKVARLGCMVCRRLFDNLQLIDSPVELHHMRGGRGWGKGDYTTLIPLCLEHHRGNTGVHSLGTKGFVKRYGFSEQELLDDVERMLDV